MFKKKLMHVEKDRKKVLQKEAIVTLNTSTFVQHVIQNNLKFIFYKASNQKAK